MAGYKKNMAQYENLTGWEKLSLGKQLDKWAVQYGDRIAVADREKEITYLELNQKNNRLYIWRVSAVYGDSSRIIGAR